MQSSNPVLTNVEFAPAYADDSQVMTVSGTANKTMVLLAILVATAGVTWWQFTQGLNIMPFMWGSLIGGAVLALVISFKPTTAPFLAPLYAATEGVFVGAISGYLNQFQPGLPFQAACLTFGTLFSLLMAYQAGWIQVTAKFRSGVIAATMGIALVYVASIVMRMFGAQMPFIHDSGWIGIGFSLFVVAIAAMNLLLDFDLIDNLADQQAPKYYEWYGGFALTVTLVWLYIEFLRLLSKLNRD